MIRAGKLDRTITIERVTMTPNDAGTPQETWAVLVTLRAELLDSAATETVNGAGENTERAIAFRTRFYPGVTVADRISYEGQSFNLRQVKELGRRRGLELRAERAGP